MYVNTIDKNPTKYQKLFKRLGTSNIYLSFVSLIQLSDILTGYKKENSIQKHTVKSVEFIANVAVIQRRFVESSLELQNATSVNQVSGKLTSIARVQLQMKNFLVQSECFSELDILY